MEGFKAGEKIWCCAVCDSTHRNTEPEIIIHIMQGTVRNILKQSITGIAGLELVALQDNVIISDSNHQNFKTKNDAIEAMILELQNLKE